MSMEDLASVLTHERRLLGELVYRLEALLYFASRDDMELLERAATEATESIAAVRDADAMGRLLETLEIGSLCGFGQGVPRPIRDLLRHFGDEVFA